MKRDVTQQVLDHVAEVAATELPLATGLRVAAREASGSRTARALRRVATRIEAGESLQQTLDEGELRLPPHVRGLLKTATSQSDVCAILVELSQHQRELQAVRREILSALAYPTVLVCCALLVAAFVIQAVVPGLQSMYEVLRDFEISPIGVGGTITVIWFNERGLRMCLYFFVLVLLVALLLRLGLGRGNWRWLMCTAPLFGPLLMCAGTWEFSRLMRMLLHRGIPLPQALRLAADGVHDANLADAARHVADQVESGADVGQSMFEATRIPATLSALVDWGERHEALADSFDVAANVFEGRVRLRAAWLNVALPPVIYIAVAAVAIGLAVSLIAPLITMIQALS